MKNQVFSGLPAVYSEKPTVLQITEDDAGRLSPWRLEAGHVVSYHYHRAVEIGYCFEGSGTHYSKDGAFPFHAGDALFIIPGHPHYTVSDAGAATKWMFLYFDLQALADAAFQGTELPESGALNPEITLYEIISGDRYPEICRLILQIVRQYQSFRPGRTEFLCVLCMELLLLLGREGGTLPRCRVRPAAEYGRMEPVVRHIHAAVESGRIPGLEELAALCYMSPSHFRSVFREVVGVPPHDYVIQLAIRRTQELLLSSDKSILDICAAAGFRSVSSLNRNFQRQCGMSPKAYRQAHQYLY